VPYILDTDHLSVLQWREQPAYERLIERLDQLPPDDLATTIVSFQEQVQGWLAYLARAKNPDQVVRAYARLEAIWRAFLKMNVLSFAQLRRQRTRMQTLDLRIASIALATDSTLLSRNLRDFRRVPGLLVEDWTV
jgi:tRNA(fMet)-specific endonuclease VapC